jgi:hypothetical protein
MNQLTRLIILGNILRLIAESASAQQVRDAVLDDRAVYQVPVSATRVTTISFPSAIAAIDGALVSTDGKTPGVFQVAHTKGTAYFSARALAQDGVTNLNVRWNNRTYVFELRESGEPCYSFILRNPAERVGKANGPMTPNRLLGLLDKAKAFPLLQQHQPELVRDVEFRDLKSAPLVSDCGGYEVRCEEAFRFAAPDSLVFRLTVINKSDKPLEHTPEKLEVRVGEHVVTPSLADVPSEIAARSSATGYVAVHCGASAELRTLSLKNEFSFNLSRREAPGVLPELGELPDLSK